MPRDRKMDVRPSESYGESTAARQSLDRVPATGASPGLQAVPNAPAPDPKALAIQGAFNSDPSRSLLTQPSRRPTEPVQTGLSLGPGAGPSVLKSNRSGRVADNLEMAAMITGNASLAVMAKRVRARIDNTYRINRRPHFTGQDVPGRKRPGVDQGPKNESYGLLPAQSAQQKREPVGQGLKPGRDNVAAGLGPGIPPLPSRKQEDTQANLGGEGNDPNRVGELKKRPNPITPARGPR